MNGLLSIGNNGLSAESKNPDYLSGSQQGVAQRDSGTVSHILPIQTDDEIMMAQYRWTTTGTYTRPFYIMVFVHPVIHKNIVEEIKLDIMMKVGH